MRVIVMLITCIELKLSLEGFTQLIYKLAEIYYFERKLRTYCIFTRRTFDAFWIWSKPRSYLIPFRSEQPAAK